MNLKHLFLLLITCFLFQQTSQAQCGTVVGDTVYVTSAFNVAGSLRNAINCVNNTANSIRFIHFNINNPGVITIQPTGAAPLPAITKPNVVIDARTQPGWYLGKIVISANLAGNVDGLVLSASNVSVYGLTFSGFTNANRGGVLLAGNNALLAQNAFIGNRYGIQTASPSSFTARDNFIGVDPVTLAANGNLAGGINILSSVGTFVITDNTIANNPLGIFAASGAVQLLASENSIYCNGTNGIERSGFTVSGFALTTATTSAISGTGPNGALVEVFIHDDTGCQANPPPCQGKIFLGAATVSGGSWTLNVAAGAVQVGDEITATATAGGNNTSEFLGCLTAACPTGTIGFSNVQDACGNTPTGSATATVNGGGSFSYEWSDGQLNNVATDLIPDNYSVTATDPAGCTYTGNITIDALVVPTANPFGNDPLCVGETLALTANVSGGTPNYTYSWEGPGGFTSNQANPGRANLQLNEGGTYSLTVTDTNTCTDRANTQVTVNDLPTFNLAAQDVSCNGAADGSIDLTPIAVPDPVTYLWSNAANTQDISNLSPGTYTVTVTDGNTCTATDSRTIGEPPALVISNNQVTDVSCAGEMDGSISLTLMNGTAPITYSWSNGAVTEDIMGLAVGNYAFTATDANGCQVFFSTPITAPSPVLISNVQTTPPTSQGGNDGTLRFNISGGTAPYTYAWTGPANGSANLPAAGQATLSNLPAGAYNLLVTDGNGCTTSQAFAINPFNCTLVISNATTSNESCAGEMDGSISLTVGSGTPPYSYNWTSDPLSGSGMGTNITGLSGASYAITITGQDNCSATTSQVVNTTTVPPPGSANLSSCDTGSGMAPFDLTTLEGTINSDPNLTVQWFADAAGMLPIPDPANYTAGSGPVYAALSQGNCRSTLTGSQLMVLPDSDPACMGGGCTSFAGTFSLTTPQTACSSFSAAALYQNDAVLDANDTLLFVLHTQAGASLGTVLAIGASPTATFDPNTMTYGTTYYLTAVVGNAGGAGGIDLTDPCLSVAAGQAVVFTESLGGVLNFIQGEEVLCQGEDLFLSTNVLTGLGLTYHWILPNGDTLVTNTANLLVENCEPADAGDYYVFVEEAPCLFDQTGPFTLTVLGLLPGERIDAGRDTLICDTEFILQAAPITDGNGSWTGPAGVKIAAPNAANTPVTDLRNGINQFIWTVSTPGCGVIGTDTLNVVVASGLQAADDFFTLKQANSEIFMDVLKNDGLAANTAYTLRALSQPDFGTLLTLDHGFQYFESEGRRGTVTFVYELCYTNGSCASSCDTATVTIMVLNLPYLPEGFTPNDDNRNDVLAVLGYSGGGDISMKIMITNRWGDIVYEADNYLLEPPWDGHLRSANQPLPEGTYYAWLEIMVDGVIYQQSQALYLIR